MLPTCRLLALNHSEAGPLNDLARNIRLDGFLHLGAMVRWLAARLALARIAAAEGPRSTPISAPIP